MAFKNARNRPKRKMTMLGSVRLSYTKSGHSFINWKRHKSKGIIKP